MTGDLPDNDHMQKYNVKLKQEQSSWSTSFDFPENLVGGETEPAQGGTVTFTWDATNNQVKASIKLTK